MTKRILAVLMALALCLSLAPGQYTALAASGGGTGDASSDDDEDLTAGVALTCDGVAVTETVTDYFFADCQSTIYYLEMDAGSSCVLGIDGVSDLSAYDYLSGGTTVAVNGTTLTANVVSSTIICIGGTDSDGNDVETYVYVDVALATPTISSVVQSGSKVTVKWGKVTGASGYYVYRKASGESSYTKVATITSGSTVSWKDTSSKSNGKTYYYKVKAYDDSTKSAASSYKSIKYMKGTVSSLTNKSTGIKVKWSKVSGASGYYIYRKASGASSYTKVKTITSASTVSYTDTAVKSKNGTTYTYYVQPYNSTSKGAYVTKKTVRLTGTTISSLTNSSSKKMTVKWGKNSKATGYQIQYSTSSSFSSKKTVTVKSYKTVSKTISSLTKGKTYYVRVRSYKTVSGTKYYSAWSAKKKVKISK